MGSRLTYASSREVIVRHTPENLEVNPLKNTRKSLTRRKDFLRFVLINKKELEAKEVLWSNNLLATNCT